jgi:hypothetical protein
MFKNYTTTVKLYTGTFESYFIDDSGKLMYSVSLRNNKKISDIVTDKYAASDKKIKKSAVSVKQYAAKLARDNMRSKIKTYLANIVTTVFYRIDKSTDKPQKITEISGQLLNKGVDKDTFAAFFGTTQYNFEKALKPDINKVTVAYKLFDDIKSRSFIGIGFDGIFNFNAGKNIQYNSADCFVDTLNNKVSVIMNFDYLKSNVGTLYTATYTASAFDKVTKITDKAYQVAHFNSNQTYFVNSDSSLVKDNVRNVVLKDYSYSSSVPSVPLVFTSISTGKKDKFGNLIKKDTAYMINEKGAVKLGSIDNNKQIVPKASAFAYFTDFSYDTNKGNAVIYNGSKFIKLGNSVSIIYNFTK